MNDGTPLYNSRITKNYLEYLEHFHPDVDVEAIFAYAGMSRFEVDDPGHWFSQRQVDRFQERLVTKTGNPNISKDVGRYLTSSEGLGAVKQYALGFLNLTSIYVLMGKFYPMMSRAAEVNANKISSNSVEIISTPKPDVREKPYQCENRLGTFESLAKWFTKGYAKIDHPECLHKGEKTCRYIITWEKTPAIIWKRIKNILLLLSPIAVAATFPLIQFTAWVTIIAGITLLNLVLSIYTNQLEKGELVKTIEYQGNAAKDLFDEINLRYNHAKLIQEIGQTTSNVLHVEVLISTVMGILEKHLYFDRGLILLTDRKKTVLTYRTGYGYSEKQEALLRETEFHLDRPNAKGVFIVSFREQKPFLINNITEIEKDLSERSLEFARKMGAHSLICSPIVYEKESLGILAVDNVKSKKPLTKSDISLLEGIASQTGVGIINARSFEKLQESEKKYRDLVENANSIILRRDIKGLITFFNEYAQKLFGFREEEIIGRNLIGTIHPDSGPARRQMANLNASMQMYPDLPQVSEDKNILRDKSHVWIAWTYKPIFDENNEIREILCIGNDVTELRKAEEEKKDLENRLVRAQKMEALGTLAGGVAHDLNNILSGIVSYPELLLMGLPEDSPMKKPVLTIQKSGEKAAAIVQDLLTLARRGVVTKKVISLNDIIKEYLASPEHIRLEHSHPHLTVDARLSEDLLNIQGSAVHLSKTIMNLVTNAAEAMPKDGILRVETVNRYVDWPIGGYDQVEEGDYVTVTVSDTGIGIPKSDIERIFEPFFTKKVMGKSGTGLGMAVVWGTVKDHNGHIDVESIEGEGTKFTLYFPVTRKALQESDVAAPLENYKGRGESVLIVDDAHEQREIASKMLAKLGYKAFSVASGEGAVEYIKENTVDLLLLDMIMEPGIDGYETYKRIKRINPRQKAIIASGFSETGRVKAAQKLGAGPYIKKPYLLNKIAKAIRNELDR